MTNRVQVELDAKDELTPAVKAIAASVGFTQLKAGIGDISKKLSEMGQAAADDEASTLKLKRSVENTGATWSTYEKQLDDVIATSLKKGFTDDAARDSLSLLVAQTDSAEEAQRRYAIAQDFARGAGIELTVASKLMGRVTEENVNIFARYGIAAKEGMSQTELFAMVQQKFGGQAEEFARSNAGAMQAQRLEMGELREEMGAKFLPVQAAVTRGFLDAPQPIKLVGVALMDFGPQVAQTTIGLLAMAPATMSAVKAIGALGPAALAAGPLVLGLAAAFGVAYGASKLLGGDGNGALEKLAQALQQTEDPLIKIKLLEDEAARSHKFVREELEKEIKKLKEQQEQNIATSAAVDAASVATSGYTTAQKDAAMAIAATNSKLGEQESKLRATNDLLNAAMGLNAAAATGADVAGHGTGAGGGSVGGPGMVWNGSGWVPAPKHTPEEQARYADLTARQARGVQLGADALAFLASYATGTGFVPQDGPAMLHRGERVVNAADNAMGMSGGGITVVMQNAVIYASNKEEATRSMGDVGWGLGMALRQRGLNV